MGYSKGSKERAFTEGNVMRVLEFRDKIFGGGERSPETYLSFLQVLTILSGTEHQRKSLRQRSGN